MPYICRNRRSREYYKAWQKKFYQMIKMKGGGAKAFWTIMVKNCSIDILDPMGHPFFGLKSSTGKAHLWTYAGPEISEVVLVSAAHCNFICKVLRVYQKFWKKALSVLNSGWRQQHGGDLLLSQFKSPWILSSKITNRRPEELLLRK